MDGHEEKDKQTHVIIGGRHDFASRIEQLPKATARREPRPPLIFDGAVSEILFGICSGTRKDRSLGSISRSFLRRGILEVGHKSASSPEGIIVIAIESEVQRGVFAISRPPFHGGRGGIRTHGDISATLDFESSAFNRTQPPFPLLFKRFCGLLPFVRNSAYGPFAALSKERRKRSHRSGSKASYRNCCILAIENFSHQRVAAANYGALGTRVGGLARHAGMHSRAAATMC